MTQILMIDDNHHGKATAGVISLAEAVVAAAQVAAPLVLTWARRVTANKYVRLTAFSVVMTLATMTLVEISFDLAFNQHPYPFLNPFPATR